MSDTVEKATELLSAPLGELIAAVGKGVADAQEALDSQALNTFKSMYLDDASLYEELKKIGYQPTWYRIPEADAELKMVLTATETGQSVSRLRGASNVGLNAMPIDATVANQFNFSYAAASSIKFKVVPVPPPSSLESQRVIPELLGKTPQETTEVLDDLGLIWQSTDDKEVEDDAKVVSQYPSAGTLIAVGESLTLKFLVSGG